MSQPIPLLRLTPEAAGSLQYQHTQTLSELRELTRFRREFDRRLAALIGNDALRKLHKDTKNALLLAELIKEAA